MSYTRLIIAHYIHANKKSNIQYLNWRFLKILLKQTKT